MKLYAIVMVEENKPINNPEGDSYRCVVFIEYCSSNEDEMKNRLAITQNQWPSFSFRMVEFDL